MNNVFVGLVFVVFGQVFITQMLVSYAKFPIYLFFSKFFEVEDGDNKVMKMLMRKKMILSCSFAILIGTFIAYLGQGIIRAMVPELTLFKNSFSFGVCITFGLLDAALAGPLSDFLESKKTGMVIFKDRRKK